MGTIVRIVCRNCEYRKEFRLDVGQHYYDLERIFYLLPLRQREECYEALRGNKVLEWGDYSHRLYTCTKCHGLHGRFYAKVVYMDNDEKRVYETKYNCEECNIELTPVETTETNEDEEDILPIEKLSCPKCKVKYLAMAIVGHWD